MSAYFLFFSSLLLLAMIYFFILHVQKIYYQRRSKRFIQQNPTQFKQLTCHQNSFSIDGFDFIFPYNQTLHHPPTHYTLPPHGVASIDHIFIVNRRCDSQRLQTISQQLQSRFSFLVQQSNVLVAIDANRIGNSFKDVINNNILHPGFNRSLPCVPIHAQMWRRKGILGHYLSLYKALLLAEYNKFDHFLWIEDDCLFQDDAFLMIEDMLKNCKNDWDVINLGLAKHCYQRNKKLLSTEPVLNIHSQYNLYSLSDLKGLMYQSHALIFNRRAYQKLIHQFFPMLAPSDIAIGNLSSFKTTDVKSPFPQSCPPLLKGYFVSPPLAIQQSQTQTSLTAQSAFWS